MITPCKDFKQKKEKTRPKTDNANLFLMHNFFFTTFFPVNKHPHPKRTLFKKSFTPQGAECKTPY